MRFRPCIDLRNGCVVQIVGSSLSDNENDKTVTNFEADRPPAEYARMYRNDELPGGHLISLGHGNTQAAINALRAYPGGLHAGGGVTPENAGLYLDAGASHVIVTSYVFKNGRIDMARLRTLEKAVGKNMLVLDLSCRKSGNKYWVVTDRWQNFTEVRVNQETLAKLSDHCDEFLVHGVDVEGKCAGIESDLVTLLGEYSPIPVTYAGGVKELADFGRVNTLGKGRVDLTIGSALDIFGGQVPYRDVVAWCKKQQGVQTSVCVARDAG